MPLYIDHTANPPCTVIPGEDVTRGLLMAIHRRVRSGEVEIVGGGKVGEDVRFRNLHRPESAPSR